MVLILVMERVRGTQLEDERCSELLAALRPLIRPTGPGALSQYPRPWMTDYVAPWAARVFTVGFNQHSPYLATELPRVLDELYPGDPRSPDEKYIASLLNCPPGRCREVYERVFPGPPGPTRRNTDSVIQALGDVGIPDVVQTNVICYSTPMARDLRLPAHRNGVKRGREIFETLVQIIRPRVIIAHGAKTSRKLAETLRTLRLNGAEFTVPKPRVPPSQPLSAHIDDIVVFIIPSLAPPAFNRWGRGMLSHVAAVAEEVREILDD